MMSGLTAYNCFVAPAIGASSETFMFGLGYMYCSDVHKTKNIVACTL